MFFFVPLIYNNLAPTAVFVESSINAGPAKQNREGVKSGDYSFINLSVCYPHTEFRALVVSSPEAVGALQLKGIYTFYSRPKC